MKKILSALFVVGISCMATGVWAEEGCRTKGPEQEIRDQRSEPPSGTETASAIARRNEINKRRATLRQATKALRTPRGPHRSIRK